MGKEKLKLNVCIAAGASIVFGLLVMSLANILGIYFSWRIVLLCIGTLFVDDIAKIVYKSFAKTYLGQDAWLFNDNK